MSLAKKAKYSTNFNSQWIAEFGKWLKEENKTTARCLLCKSTFAINYEGKRAIENHIKSKSHRSALSAQKENQLVSSYFAKKSSPEAINTTIAELALVYHNVEHQLSYQSFDCGTKLACSVFQSAPVAKLIKCGRTKASALVENVLGPRALEMVIEELRLSDGTFRNFSLSSDASNKGKIIIFSHLPRSIFTIL